MALRDGLPAGRLGHLVHVARDVVHGHRLQVLGLVEVGQDEDIGRVGDVDVLAHGLLAEGLQAGDDVLVGGREEVAGQGRDALTSEKDKSGLRL